MLRGGHPIAPRLLPTGHDGRARVALVQRGACLCAGDDVRIDIEVAADAALEIVELSATIAHDVRRGPGARQRIRVELGARARLAWPSAALVVSTGAEIERRTDIELGDGAVALMRETLVLGRYGQACGRLDATLRAVHAGRPLLHEQLSTEGPELVSPVVMGGARVLDSALLLGRRGDAPGRPAEIYDLHGPGTVARVLARGAAEAERAMAPTVSHWAGLALAADSGAPRQPPVRRKRSVTAVLSDNTMQWHSPSMEHETQPSSVTPHATSNRSRRV